MFKASTEFKINDVGVAKLEKEVAAKTAAFLVRMRGKSPAEIRSAQTRIGLNLNDDAIEKLARAEL